MLQKVIYVYRIVCSFPEELNGVGCYGSSFVRVLAGAGYAVRWPSGDNFVFADVSRTPLSTSLSLASYSTGYGTQCKCASSAKTAKVVEFVSHMNNTFTR